MSRYADWYAVELDGYLRGRMSEVQRFEATKEITNHFAEHVDDLVGKGMDPVEAEKAAIVAFGPPRKTAINLLEGSKGNALGKWLILVACLMITLLTFSMGLMGILNKLQAYFQSPYNGYFYVHLYKAWVILGLSLIGGIILTRRVPVAKMFLAGGLGIAMIGVFFFLGPELNYGNVPKAKFNTMMTKWQSAHEATIRLAIQEKAIVESTYADRYMVDRPVIKDQALAIERIKSDAPQMLAISSEYVKVSGTRIGGYLGPPLVSTAMRLRGHQDDGIDPRYSTAETGDMFPLARRTFQYYETPQAALKAWTETQQMYGSNYSVFGYAARDQEEFIRGAEKFGKLSGPQQFAATIVPVVLVVLAFLGSMMIIGWPLTKIPVVTVRTSFRRRFA